MVMARRVTIDQMRRRMEATFNRASALPHEDELCADISDYLCVRISGFVERSIFELLSEHTRPRAAANIAEFVSAKIEKNTNLDSGKLPEILGQFDQKWKQSVELFFKNNPDCKEALDAVVHKRHRIAHGYPDRAGLVAVKKWFELVVKLVAHLESVVTGVAPR